MPPASSFSGSQILVALLTGLLMAFAFQLLLTNLGVAVGISALGWWGKFQAAEAQSSDAPEPAPSEQRSPSAQPPPDDPKTLPNAEAADSAGLAGKIGFAAGLGILLTINTVLFVACWLAVKLTVIPDPLVGAILGIVIWSAYFLILTWVSSTAVSSAVGNFFSSLSTGFRRLFTLARTVFQPDEQTKSLPLDSNAAIALIRQDIEAVIAEEVQKVVAEEVEPMSASRLDLKAIRRDLETLLTEFNERSAPEARLNPVDRQTVLEVIGDRTPLSPVEVEQVADQLEAVWKSFSAASSQPDLNAQILEFVKTADPEDLKFNRLTAKIEGLLQPASSASDLPEPTGLNDPTDSSDLSDSSESRAIAVAAEILPSSSPPSTAQQILGNIDFKALLRTALQRVDLSDLEVESVWQQLRQVQQFISGPIDSAETASLNTVQADLEAYLLEAYPWRLNRETVEAELKDLLHDPDAAPALVRQQVEQIHLPDVKDCLHQRPDLSEAQIAALLERLESAQNQVLAAVQAAEVEAQRQAFRDRLQVLLDSPDLDDWSAEAWDEKLQEIVFSPENEQLWAQIYAELTPAFFQQALQDTDLEPKSAKALSQKIQASCDRLLQSRQAQQAEVEAALADLWEKLESYLRYTRLDWLTPEGIERKLRSLLEDSPLSPKMLQVHIPELDREALITLLDRRQGLDLEQRSQIVNRIEALWQQLIPPAPNAPASTQTVPAEIAQYLQHVNWSDLDLEAVRQHVLELLNDPKLGAWNLVREVGRLDWNPVLAQLRERQDFDPTQREQIMEVIRGAVHQVAKVPRRWAVRTRHAWNQTRAEAFEFSSDFSADLQDYLRHANKAEFETEQIQHNLKQIFKAAQAPIKRGSSRVSKVFDYHLSGGKSPQNSLSDGALTKPLPHERPEDLSDGKLAEPLQDAQLSRDKLLSAQDDQSSNGQSSSEQEMDGQQSQPPQADRGRSESPTEQNVSVEADRAAWLDSLLQRKDVTEAEAHRIVEQLEQAYQDSWNTLQATQTQVETRAEQVLDSVRTYLASLDFPDFNPEAMLEEIRQFLDRSQTELTAILQDSSLASWGDRLSQWLETVWSQVLEVGQQVPETISDYGADWTEQLGDRLRGRMGAVQQRVQQRIDGVKQQAQRQAEQARKAAAAAAWWLFGTALTSALTSALAGALAVGWDFRILFPGG